MVHFWKWLGLSTLCAAVIYGALIGLSAFQIPWRSAHFDTAAATTTQPGWVNEARYFVLNKQAFAASGDRIVVMGASNARDPFRPEIMEHRLSGWQVANASLSGAGIDEIADAVDLYYQQREQTGARTVFVISLNYLQFLESPYSADHENPLATEAMRSGLYERREGRLTARLPQPAEEVVVMTARPQAVVASLPRRLFRAVFVNPDLPQVKEAVDRFRGDDPLSRWTEFIGEQRDLDTVTVPADIQQALMAQRLAGAGGDKPLGQDGFRTLADMIALIRSNGDAIVIVDLPLPEWHFAGVPVTDASYRASLARVLDGRRNDKGVGFLSLRDFNDNDNFFDSAHTKPRLWPILSERLAERLAAMPALAGHPPEGG